MHADDGVYEVRFVYRFLMEVRRMHIRTGAKDRRLERKIDRVEGRRPISQHICDHVNDV